MKIIITPEPVLFEKRREEKYDDVKRLIDDIMLQIMALLIFQITTYLEQSKSRIHDA